MIIGLQYPEMSQFQKVLKESGHTPKQMVFLLHPSSIQCLADSGLLLAVRTPKLPHPDVVSNTMTALRCLLDPLTG